MLFAKLEPKIQDIGANGFAMAYLQLGTKWECGEHIQAEPETANNLMRW